MIQIRENINDVAEFNLLYDSVGWGAYDKKITKKAMENTYYSVSILIMEKLISKINKMQERNSDMRTYLGASKGKEKFYEKFGFITRIDAGLGSGMILKNK